MIVCTVTMLGLKPWEPNESVPSLAQPALEARVGDGVAVPTVGPAVAVVQAAVAPGKAELVGKPGPRPGEGESEGEGRDGASAVGPSMAVAAPASKKTGGAPESAPPAESPAPAAVPPVAAPSPELASVPTTPPSASPPPPAKAPGGGGPVAVGTPRSPAEAEEEPGEGGEEPGSEEPGAGEEEVCAGDEYTLTITPLEVEGEAVAIVLEHVVADGSVETLELEGNLEDARSLVLQLSSEGGCVEVEVVSPEPTTP